MTPLTAHANSLLEDAARAYVDARLAAEGQDGPGWLAHTLEVDGSWHELVLLCERCDCGVCG